MSNVVKASDYDFAPDPIDYYYICKKVMGEDYMEILEHGEMSADQAIKRRDKLVKDGSYDLAMSSAYIGIFVKSNKVGG